MNIDFILNSVLNNGNREAIITEEKTYTFQDVYSEYEKYKCIIKDYAIAENSVVAVLADYHTESIALLLVLIENNCIIVPVSETVKMLDQYLRVSEAEYFIDLSGTEFVLRKCGQTVANPLLLMLKSGKKPGLILFSSGTTGEPKAALHDLTALMDKFRKPGKMMKTITFLLFDHIGGFNTLMHTLAGGGTIVTMVSRDAEAVCRVIEKQKVELLPTSPTFINLMLIQKMHERYDLTCLKLITYGTENMPQSTLDQLHAALPEVRLKQTYGLSEVGIMSTKSQSDDSLWMKLGGEGFETKVADDILFIRAKSAMLGYLNAPSPFDDEGWFNTKDKVEVKGEYFRILGRTTDIINVGGEKVYPIEVESVLLCCDGVLDVSVIGEKSDLLGCVVVAKVQVAAENNNRAFIKILRSFCKDRLEKYKIPVKFTLAEGPLFSDRFKKKR